VEIGMVIQKASGKSLSEYLTESFSEPMGFENEALWQVDDAEHRLAKSYCCIASNARDFARFGKLYSNSGTWKSVSILDSSFVATSTRQRFNKSPEYGYGFWLSDHLNKKNLCNARYSRAICNKDSRGQSYYCPTWSSAWWKVRNALYR
jgi:CubicO group peptidase (beta-lactamase class C family)